MEKVLIRKRLGKANHVIKFFGSCLLMSLQGQHCKNHTPFTYWT